MAYSDEVLADSPLGYWRLGEASGTTAADASGNARPGTYSGAPTLGAAGLLVGDADTSVDFDGIDDRVTVAHGSWMTASASFTASALFRADSTTGSRVILARVVDLAAAWMLRIDSGTLTLWFNTNGSSGWVSLAAGAVSVGTTYHVAVTYDSATTTRKVYLDGAEVATGSGTAPFVGTAGLGIGSWPAAATEVFDGRIDEAAFFGAALSAVRISAHRAAAETLWASTVNGLTPWAWYRFNETSGAAQDSSGNARHAGLSAFGNPTYQQASLVPSDLANKAYGLTGAVGPRTPGLAVNANTGITVAMVYKGTGVGTGNKPLWQQEAETAVYASGNFVFLGWNGNSDSGVSANIIKDNVAHLIVVTYKSGQQRLWVDGVLRATGTASILTDTARWFELGRDGGSHSLDGTYDEFIIDTGIWTDTQITDLHAAWAGSLSAPVNQVSETDTAQAVGLGSVESATYEQEVLADSPLSYHRLGETSGTTMNDASVNARHGTYSGAITLGETGGLTGNVDKAALFAGGTASVTAASWMQVTTAFTVEMLVKPSNVSGTKSLASRADYSVSASSTQYSWGMRLVGANLHLQFVSSGGVNTEFTSNGAPFTAGVWHHVVYTFDGTTMRGYVNGSQVMSSTAASGQSAGAAAAKDLQIGNNYFTGWPMAGTIDEFAFYGTALSGARITAHYNNSIGSGSPAARTIALAQPVEPDTAIPIVAAQNTRELGQVVETDTSCQVHKTPFEPVTGGGFDPQSIPGLVMWLSADAITGLANGAAVATWSDQSGLGNHASSTGTITYQSAGGFGGGPRIAMGGGYFTLPNGIMSGKTAGEAFLSLQATNQNGAIWGISPGGSLLGHYPHATGYYENFGINARPQITAETAFTTAWQKLDMWSAPNDFAVDVSPAGITHASNQGAVAWNTTTSWLFTNGTYQLTGSCGYVILYDRKLTATERADLKAWLDLNPSGGVPGAPKQNLEVKQAQETDSAESVSQGILAELLAVQEIDTAFPVAKKLGLNQALQASTAQPMGIIAPPDPFAAPWDIAGSAGIFSLDMTNHTLEAGEPNPNGAIRTAWLRWTAPDDLTGAMQRFHTRGSTPDTTLAVFTGTALNTLTQVAASDNAVGTAADLKWALVSGTTYMIQVGTKTNPASSVVVTWLSGEPSEHDPFATPLVLPGQYGQDELTTSNGTMETGEPVPSGMVASSWLEWTATSSEPVTFSVQSTSTSSFTVTVYSGTAVNALTSWASATGTGLVTVTLSPDSGTTYQIQVGGSDDLLDFEVAWSVQADPVTPVPLPIPPDVSGDPFIADPMLPEVYLRVEIYDRAGQTLITEIPRRLNVQWQELLNVPGSGSVMIPSNDEILEAYPDLLDWGNVGKFWLGDVCVMAFSIRGRSTSVVASEEWTGLATTISGPSVHYWLKDFIIRHDGNPRPDSLASRYYSWASKPGEWYDSSKWEAQVNEWTLQNPPSTKKEKKPKNWKVSTAKWINTTKSGGWRYFRKNWTNQVDGRLVRIFATADEWWRLYIDGEEVLSDDPREIGYLKFKKYDTVLSKGQHTFAAVNRMFHSAKGDGNDSFLFAMCELDLNGKIIKPPLLVSNNSWLGHKGNPPPGWRRAHVLRSAVQEAKDRGVHSALRLTLGFTGDTDSEGKPWPDSDLFNQEVAIGTSGLDLQAQLSEGNGFDVWVDPETLTLHASRRRGTDKSASVTFEAGRNLLDWAVDEQDEVENSWLIQYDKGWTEYNAKVSQEKYDVRETYVSVGGVKEEKGAKSLIKRASQGIAKAQQRAGTDEIRKKPFGQPDGGLIGVEGAYPFLDFGVGDIVKAPNSKGTMVPQRLLGLTGSESIDGFLSFDPDMEEVSAGG